MSDHVETMAWTNEVPWHGLGHKVGNNLSPAQMLKAAEIDWTVSKQPVFFSKQNGAKSIVKDKLILVRDSDEKPLSMVGTTYKPVQNEEAMDFFKKFVVAGHMSMETAGSLWGGRYIWCLAKVGKDFSIGKDEVKSYLLLCQPHVHGKAMVIQFTPIRVVCWNTLNFALGSKLKGNASAFRMPHSMTFNDDVKKKAEVALGLAQEQMVEFKEAVTLLSKKKASEEKTEEFFCEVLQFDPKKAKKNKEREPRILNQFRQALTHAPGQQLPSALGTAWGAVNAVTYVVDHQLGRDNDTALKTAWLGAKATLKRRALSVAIDKFK